MWRKLAVVCATGALLLSKTSPYGVELADAVSNQFGANVIADRPAATLLLPYFEVDLGTSNGRNTVFSINNAGATAVLTKVTIWSDLGVPVFGFPVYLTGYDVQRVDLRNIIQLGLLPTTASLGQDGGDTFSPKGSLSLDSDFASCNGILPPTPLTPTEVSHLQTSLTGQASPMDSQCRGLNVGDSIARGYVTVDTVNNCTNRSPSDAGYFAAGGTGDATNQNVLWGDFFFFNPLPPPPGSAGATLRYGGTLVHIRASATDPETSVAGQYTFYGRYVNWTAVDNRQPLPTQFVARYFGGALFSTGTSLLVWRDSKVNQQAFTCPVTPGARPLWYPLGQEEVVIFDEQEHPSVMPQPTVFPPPPIPSLIPFAAATQRVPVGGATLPVPFAAGWFNLNLNQTNAAAGANPPEDPAAAQAWVYVVQDSNGRFSLGYPAVHLDSATKALHNHVGN